MPHRLRRILATADMAYHARGQGRYPFRPLAGIQSDRDRRVRSIAAYAYRYVPYYRETMDRIGLTPSDIGTAEDLRKLPLIARRNLQADPEYFVSTERPLASYLELSTSGTTARPCAFYQDAAAVLLSAVHAGRARAAFTPLLGKSAGYRKTTILAPRGNSATIQRFFRERAYLPPRVRLVRQRLTHYTPPEDNAPLVRRFAPDVLQSYGSYLALFFAHLKASGQRLPTVKAILVSADHLPESARQLIQGTFKIPAFSTYEATEAANIAFECERHSGLHINIDLCHLRIVDPQGETAKPGVSGDVVISNLVNRGTVLLNYLVGDLAVMATEPCPCGRSLPLLSELQGRSNDCIELPTGELRHPFGLGQAFRRPGVWQWQLVQETTTRFRASIVVDRKCDRERTRSAIAQELIEELGEAISLEIRFVDQVERTPSGKVRSVVSHLGKSRLQALLDEALGQE